MAVHKTRRAAADHKVVAQAIDILAEAKDPLILAGNGAVRKRAASQLQRLAHKTGIAVVNTFMGKGAVPRSDPHCLIHPRPAGPRPRQRGDRQGRRHHFGGLRSGRVQPLASEQERRQEDRPH